jgi:hypothetical protein
MKTRRQKIIDTIQDLAGSFMLHDRKEDEELPVGEIEEAVKSGEITIGEIAFFFKKALGFDDQLNPKQKEK